MPLVEISAIAKQASRRVSFESHEIFYLATKVTADIQSADQDELIRQRNTDGGRLFPRLGIDRANIQPNTAKKGESCAGAGLLRLNTLR